MAEISEQDIMSKIIDDIATREQLEPYLLKIPPAQGVAVGFRASLRILPFILDDDIALKLMRSDKSAALLLRALFRASCSTFTRCMSTDEGSRTVAVAADTFAASAGADAKEASAAIKAAVRSAAAQDHAGVARASARAVSRSLDCIGDAHSAIIWNAVRNDLRISSQQDQMALLRQPLWNGGVPPSVAAQEVRFSKVIASISDDWVVLEEWYTLFRNNQWSTTFSPMGGIDISRMYSEDFWSQSNLSNVFYFITSNISGANETHESYNQSESLKTIRGSLRQAYASFRFVNSEFYEIDAVPVAPLNLNEDFSYSTLAEARTKADEYYSTLRKVNLSPRFLQGAHDLRLFLSSELSDINPGVLRSKFRSLESHIFAISISKDETNPDVVASAHDVLLTLRDLQGCFPIVSLIEREIAKIDIAGREKDVEDALDDILRAAKEISVAEPGTITERTVAVLEDHISQIRADRDNNDGTDSLVSAGLVAGNFLTFVFKKLLVPIGRETARIGKLHYTAAIDASVEGTKELASKGPLLTLAYWIGGPTLAIATLFTAFKSLKDAQAATTAQAEKPEEDVEE